MKALIFLVFAGLICVGQTQSPAVTEIQNNYSYIVPGMPNYGIAPGSLFIVKGTDLSTQPLSALQSSAPPGLPTTLNGTNMTVTVGSVVTKPAIYYTSPTQIGAVLPSNTPAGNGTLVVTVNGQPSPAAPIVVVASAMGFDSLTGIGAGFAVAQDANFDLLSPTNPARPGQAIILWGSGVGADLTNDDRTFPQQEDNLTGIPFQVFIGGIQAVVSYRGRSQYPGVDQVVVTIPANVTPGCFVSVIAMSGGTPTNTVAVPVSENGSACSDPNLLVQGAQATQLAQKGILHVATLSIGIEMTTGAPSVSDAGNFTTEPGTDTGYYTGWLVASSGSCTIAPPQLSYVVVSETPLNPGTIQVTGATSTAAVPPITFLSGFYGSDLAQNFVLPGGAFTFTGSGGDIGPFTVSGTLPRAFTWNELLKTASISRAQGFTVSWSGGEPGSYVSIQGSSATTIGTQRLSAVFICTAPVSAQEFTIPPEVLLQLPAGKGTFSVTDSVLQPLNAQGVDIGSVGSSIGGLVNISVQ